MAVDAINSYVVGCIRRERIEQRLKVADMARRAGIPLGSYSCLETGRYRLSLENAFRILAVLGMDIEEVWPHAICPVEQVTDTYILQTVEKAREGRPKPMGYGDILAAVCEAYSLTPEHLSGASRRHDICDARMVASLLTREQPHLTLAGLSPLLKRHVTGLVHCLRRCKPRLEYNKPLQHQLAVSRQALSRRKLSASPVF